MQIKYSAEDVVNANAQHWKRSFFGFKFARVVFIFGLILGVFYAYLAYLAGEGINGMALAAIAGFAAIVAILSAMSLINRYVFLPRSARKAMMQMKEYHGPWDFAFNDHRLFIKTPRGEATLPFTDFLKWNEDDRLILLYRTDKMFNLLPKQQFDAEFLQMLRTELVAANVPHASFGNS
jgi:hypothetical protein